MSSLARYQCNPREGHLAAVIKIFGYLKKYPKRGIMINFSKPMHINLMEVAKPDFGNQYCDLNEDS